MKFFFWLCEQCDRSLKLGQYTRKNKKCGYICIGYLKSSFNKFLFLHFNRNQDFASSTAFKTAKTALFHKSEHSSLSWSA